MTPRPHATAVAPLSCRSRAMPSLRLLAAQLTSHARVQHNNAGRRRSVAAMLAPWSLARTRPPLHPPLSVSVRSIRYEAQSQCDSDCRGMLREIFPDRHGFRFGAGIPFQSRQIDAAALCGDCAAPIRMQTYFCGLPADVQNEHQNLWHHRGGKSRLSGRVPIPKAQSASDAIHLPQTRLARFPLCSPTLTPHARSRPATCYASNEVYHLRTRRAYPCLERPDRVLKTWPHSLVLGRPPRTPQKANRQAIRGPFAHPTSVCPRQPVALAANIACRNENRATRTMRWMDGVQCAPGDNCRVVRCALELVGRTFASLRSVQAAKNLHLDGPNRAVTLAPWAGTGCQGVLKRCFRLGALRPALSLPPPPDTKVGVANGTAVDEPETASATSLITLCEGAGHVRRRFQIIAIGLRGE